MNKLIEDEFPLAEGQSLRYELLDALSDADLAYKLPGNNSTLGVLLHEIGRVELIYINSFKTFKQEWPEELQDPDPAISIDKLRSWYQSLDEEFQSVVAQFSDEELQSKNIDRGHGFAPSLFIQFHIFREALHILYGKVSVYMKALQNPVNDKWQAWIG